MTDSTLSEVFSESVNKAVSEAVSKAVSQTLQTIYPVGAYYISESATNPATLFGFGTWELLKDRTLIGAGSSYSVGAQGGEATHTLTVAEMPSHTHAIQGFNNVTAGSGSVSYQLYCRALFPNDPEDSGKIIATGGGSAHNNLPPYRAVYIFRRTA
jgi:hypothetical protein